MVSIPRATCSHKLLYILPKLSNLKEIFFPMKICNENNFQTQPAGSGQYCSDHNACAK